NIRDGVAVDQRVLADTLNMDTVSRNGAAQNIADAVANDAGIIAALNEDAATISIDGVSFAADITADRDVICVGQDDGRAVALTVQRIAADDIGARGIGQLDAVDGRAGGIQRTRGRTGRIDGVARDGDVGDIA